jgi:hypothetical protein
MPAAGYLGYLPFSLELFALYHLITGPLLPARNRRYLSITNGEP